MASSDSQFALPEDSKGAAGELRRAGLAGRFALAGEVIASSFGSTVFLGADRTSGAPVAVKLVQKPGPEEGEDAQEELRRSLDEVRLHAALPPHPHVLQLLSAEETLSAFLLVTPFVPDGNLWDIMKFGQTFFESEVRNCASQLMAALRHIHACGLVHGDLKPHNLLLERVRGRLVIRLCDFGLSRYVGDADGRVEFTGQSGTPGWLAPEQMLETEFGLAVDLFASGLIVFQLIGGYAPFHPATACLEAAAEFDERCWCHVGVACRDFTSTLLAMNPEERSTAMALCQHPWLMGPPPAVPSEELMRRLAASGGVPSKEVRFWLADEIPRHHASMAREPPDPLANERLAAELERSLQVLPCH